MEDGESSRILQKDSSAIIEKLIEYKKHHHRKNEKIKKLQSEIASRDSIIRRLETEIHSIHNSISWKITGPLRSLYGFFKNTK